MDVSQASLADRPRRAAIQIPVGAVSIRADRPTYGDSPEIIASTPAITVGIALAGAVYGAYMAGRAVG